MPCHSGYLLSHPRSGSESSQGINLHKLASIYSSGLSLSGHSNATEATLPDVAKLFVSAAVSEFQVPLLPKATSVVLIQLPHKQGGLIRGRLH